MIMRAISLDKQPKRSCGFFPDAFFASNPGALIRPKSRGEKPEHGYCAARNGWASSGAFAPAFRKHIVVQGKPVKVIASSIRKGNIIEREDGQLYVVLTAESFHPGKGTQIGRASCRERVYSSV